MLSYIKKKNRKIMLRKVQSVNEDNANMIHTNKRARLNRSCTNVSADSVLWSKTDESFFSNSTLDILIGNRSQVQQHDDDNNVTSKNHHFVDDSLFCDINLPNECNADNTISTSQILSNFVDTVGQCTASIHVSTPNFNDTDKSKHAENIEDIFNDVNIHDDFGIQISQKFPKHIAQTSIESNMKKFHSGITIAQSKDEDIFSDDTFDDYAVQNTQQFLKDVAFKIPILPNACREQSFNAKTIMDGLVQGTQYDTYEDIQNHTIASHNRTHLAIARETEVLTNMNWETQAFPDVYKFPSRGDFYGLPDRVKQMILNHKNIKNLYEWQDECLNLPAIFKRKNLIYALPTSGGKTLVAEILMLREVICRKKNVLFILPYVSIVQEKVCSMSPFAIAFDFIVDEYTAGKGKCPPVPRKKRKSIFIASIEKGAILMDSLIAAERANEIGLVVIDELHLIGEKRRGAILEALLTKIMFLKADIQIVGMSATIGNLPEISAFLNADVYTRGFRPVELKEYIKCGNDILEINTNGTTLEEVFAYRRTVNFKYSEAVRRADPDHLAGLVTECAPENCCLIFCSSRKNCENVAVLLTRILPKSKFLNHRKNEKSDLMDALDKVCGILSPVFAKTIPYGVAFHHSGLTIDERKFIETAYRFGVISVICCTSTLAAGVNLPAKRVIIRAPYVGAEFMTLCKYKQMVGRAGRAGMGQAGESILISSNRDNVRIGEMLFSPMDKAVSSLNDEEGLGVQSLILSAVGLGLAVCRQDLYHLLESTLLAVQGEQLGIKIKELVIHFIREMFKSKVLQLRGGDKLQTSNIVTTQDLKNESNDKSSNKDRRIYISTSTRFQLTTIGKAAFKAGIDYKRANLVYNEMKEAQKNLFLSNYTHLMYLMVCFNSNANGDELFAADAAILFRVYSDLDDVTQKIIGYLGLTESQAAQLAKKLSIKGPNQLLYNRMFKVFILLDILNMMPVPEVSIKYNIDRGMVQNLISQSTSAASAIVRLCDQIDEFWCFTSLFERLTDKMDRCSTLELEPLMELPAVKLNRAKQLYAAGFQSMESIAKCRPIQLVKAVEHLNIKVAMEIISAAKNILMKKLDSLEEETETIKECLHSTDVYSQ